jgi:RNA polymerase sigma factor (sigma-70 family)
VGGLFAIAYGMLGTTAEAEDVVQEAFARWHQADRSAVRSSAAFLSTVVTRLAIDRLRSAERRRVEYVGPWLPEPLVAELDPAGVVTEAEQLTLALPATLERLTPVERAVFLLRDVFDFDYAEIAEMLGKEVANCRQIGRRARARVGEPHRRYRATREEEDELLGVFVAAAESGDMERLTRLLACDAVLWTDGGGRVASGRRGCADRPVPARDREQGAARGAQSAGAGQRRPPRLPDRHRRRSERCGRVRARGRGDRRDPDSRQPGQAATPTPRAKKRAAHGRARCVLGGAASRFAEKYLLNPQMRLGLELGLGRGRSRSWRRPATAPGSRTEPRSETGCSATRSGSSPSTARNAGYVRNIERNPRVRVKVGRHWRAGTARILDDDDPFARLESVASALGAMRRLDAAVFRFFVRRLGTRPVIVRIDLDPLLR